MRKRKLLFGAIILAVAALASCADGGKGTTIAPSKDTIPSSAAPSDAKPHEHTYQSVWSSDEAKHWHAAACEHDVKKDEESHTWDDGVVTTPTTNESPMIKYTCTVCGKTKTAEYVSKTTVTEEEWIKALNIDESYMYTIIAKQGNYESKQFIKYSNDIYYIKIDSTQNDTQYKTQMYLQKEEDKYYQYDYQNNTWVKTEASKDFYESYKNGLAVIGAQYSEFTYDEETKSYKAEKINLLGTTIKDIVIIMLDGKLMSFSYRIEQVATVIFNFEYEEFTITLPEVHEHTYSSVWSYDEDAHWHASTCGHDVKKDEETHTWDDGVVTTPTTNESPMIKYTCTVCGQTKTTEFVGKTTVTEEEWIKALNIDESYMYTIIAKQGNYESKQFIKYSNDIYYIEVVGMQNDTQYKTQMYLQKEEDKYYQYDYQNNTWVKTEASKDFYESYKNGLAVIGAQYSEFTYDEETKSYKAEKINLLDEDLKDFVVTMSDGKLMSFSYRIEQVATVISNFEYAEFTITLPTIEVKPHEHTYSSVWSYDEAYHWHTATCGHDLIADEEKHIYNDGVIKTPETEEEPVTIIYTCTVCGQTKTTEFVGKTTVTEEEWIKAFNIDESYTYKSIVKQGDSEYYQNCKYSNDIYYIEVVGMQNGMQYKVQMYLQKEEDKYYQYSYQNNSWVKIETSKENYDSYKNGLAVIGAQYSEFTYDEETKSYKATEINLLGTTIKDIVIIMLDGKLMSFSYNDGQDATVISNFEYAEFTITLPTIEVKPHEHTYSSVWSYDEAYHWHTATCGHDLIADEEKHIYNDGVIKTPETEEEHVTIIYTCTVCGQTKTTEFVGKTTVTEEEWIKALNIDESYIYTCKATQGDSVFYQNCKYSNDIYYIESHVMQNGTQYKEEMYLQKEEDKYYEYGYQNNSWVKRETSEDFFYSFKNGLAEIGTQYSKFTYDEETKSYKAAEINLLGDKLKDFVITMSDGKLMSFSYKNEEDVNYNVSFEYAEFTITLPTM